MSSKFAESAMHDSFILFLIYMLFLLLQCALGEMQIFQIVVFIDIPNCILFTIRVWNELFHSSASLATKFFKLQAIQNFY